jgi:hypothetical protein
MDKSGRKTRRNPITKYKGFVIIQVTEIEYYKSIYGTGYSNYPKRESVHYDFCKEGDEKRPTQHYEVWADNLAECKECIDKFLEDDTLYFTAEERNKYVYKPNEKCKWAYGYESLMKVMREHQKADKRIKLLLEDRLDDANFHTEAGLLNEEKYEELEKWAADTYQFNEKFEVYTHTKRKAIKDPEKLAKAIKDAISKALADAGINDTELEVKFIKDW